MKLVDFRVWVLVLGLRVILIRYKALRAELGEDF